MKLLNKTLILFFSTSLFVFIIGGFGFYGMLKHLFYKQIDEGLLTEKAIIETEIHHNPDVPDYTSRFGHEIEVIVYNRGVKPSFSLKDTAILDTISSEETNYRYLSVFSNARKHGYYIGILQPLSGIHELFRSVAEVLLSMFLFLMLLLGLINYMISKSLWRPFYNTLKKITRYDVKDTALMEFQPTDIAEFDRLNKVLNSMSRKIRQDFYNLKEFTENASHEIQTPLAIIKSKLEILVQSEDLTPAQAELIDTISKAATRLSKLNSGLILIARIENNQYVEVESVDMALLVEHSLESFADFIEHKNLSLEKTIRRPMFVSMNYVLAEILVNNLIGNAIKHNIINGYIRISIEDNTLIISNSGNPLPGDENPLDLFSRFKKRSQNTDSLGLGLAIVKKICDTGKMSISYVNQGDEHIITIKSRF
ncbi:MAG: HAMP domain-containing sensor histidine kinase [Bacteroidota bacterium]|nr:HAMP domain-containing sensor histidine kinase [Bacteroidota bacterium]